jgi:hypothetical protein
MPTAIWLFVAAALPTDGVGMESPSKPCRLKAISDHSFAINMTNNAPLIITRNEWHAKPALPGMREQQVAAVILHNTGVRQSTKVPLEKKMFNLQVFSQHPGLVSPNHMKPAWPDVPYHFYIDFSGRIAEGRDVHFAGDTNTNYNTAGYIQLVVEGDFDEEAPNPAQISALQDLLAWLLISWNIPVENVSVHKDHASTTCPGKNFMTILPAILEVAKEQRLKIISDVCSHEPSAEFASSYCRSK